MDCISILGLPFTPEQHIEFQLQTPPVSITTSPQHGSSQLSQHTERPDFDMIDNNIPLSVPSINKHSEKMIALPVPSVRPVEINTHREAGYMGMNPITLIGETGLLPGSWGEGKEYVNVMSGDEKRRQTEEQKPVKGQVDARTRQLHRRRGDAAIIDMHELHMQYAQAVLNGTALEESSAKTSPPLVIR